MSRPAILRMPKIIDVFKYDLQKGAEKLGEKKSEE